MGAFGRMKAGSIALSATGSCSSCRTSGMRDVSAEPLVRFGLVADPHYADIDPSADGRHLVRNAAEVRALLEASGKVRAVIMGHQHCGGEGIVNGIPYYALAAMVAGRGPEANSFAEATIYPSGAFEVTGFLRAKSFAPSIRL